MEMKEIENNIIEVIDELRPFIISHGGDIQFVKFENGTVYIKMLGACANCHMLDATLKEGIEETLKNEIEEVMQVVNIA